MHAIRPSAVAGMFYPGSRAALAREVAVLLEAARSPNPAQVPPKAIIAPHAGYIYSGPIAAHAYASLQQARGKVKRVVLMGPCHRVAVRGLALPGALAFDTPLGQVPIDQDAVRAVEDLPQVIVSPAAHEQEHALEVQLPFLQTLLDEFALVPFVVGVASAEQVAQVLDRLWGGEETLIVISSDLSHYHRYDDARTIDAETCRAILDFHADIDHEQACGATPVTGLLVAAQRRGMRAQLLDARNSGDTAGDRGRVVGYASFAFWEATAPTLDETHGRVLLALARASVRAALGGPPVEMPREAWLDDKRATFVTLLQDGNLRGCVGTLDAYRSLGEDVVENARAAALEDRRFTPLTVRELDAGIDIEVSLLSAPAPIAFVDEADLHARLRPGIDGVIISGGKQRATFLPQVWEQLPDPAQFLEQLKRKAGIAADMPLTSCSVWRYTVQKWREADLRTH